MKKIIYFLVYLLPLGIVGQSITLTGSVVDLKDGSPIPGASIIEKGTNRGVLSDFEGAFEFNTNKGAILSISFLGMQTQEIKVENTTLLVKLQSEINELDEVTISVGYFDISKKDLSGAITQVTSAQLEKNRTNTVEGLLQGQIAGVVLSESSEPGGGIGISIRGTNSMLGGTQPLYVVDGIPMSTLSDAKGNGNSGQAQSTLGFLNPNDIDKIEVLKDAAATAVYGARGANGVVLITTKSADKANGTDKINLHYDYGITQVRKNIAVLDGPSFEDYLNQRVLNQVYQEITNPERSGGAFDGTQALTTENYPELLDYQVPYTTSTGINTNWQDETYQLAHRNAFNLSYRGGTYKRNLSISLGLIDQEGVVIASDNQRITYNMNAKRKAFKDRIDLFSKTNASFKKGNASSVGNGQIFSQRGVVSQALQFQPIFELLSDTQDDSIYAALNEGTSVSNPYTLANFVTDKKESVTFRQVLSIVAKITPKLTATFRGSFDYQKSTRDNYYPINTTRGRDTDGDASQAFITNKKIYSEANLRYRTRIKKHRFDAILVGTYEKNEMRSLFNRAIGYGSDATSYYNFSAATEIYVPETQFRENGLLSGLFRVGYNYNRKYYVDVNARIDASSKFASNKKSAFFPSIALAWVASKEPFLRNSEGIDNLKIRASYGKTGSNPITPYQSLALMTPIRYNFNENLTTGFFESNLANENLTWETTDQFNVGVDLSLFDSKYTFSIDAYHKLTYDLLQNVKLPVSNGYTSRVDNFGEVENKGIEIAGNFVLTKTKDFGWDIGGTWALNRNKLIALNSNLDLQLGPTVGFSESNPIIFKVGQPLGIFWGAETDGIYKDWEEANASGIAAAAPGEIIYRNNATTFDAAGEPIALQQIDFDDFVKIGDPNPDFNYSLYTNLRFKKWDLNLLFTGQKGGDLFWVDSWQLSGLQKTTNILSSSFDNSWKAPLSYTEDGYAYNTSVGNIENVKHPAAIIDNGKRAIASDRQIFDGSFLRLKNINLGYTIPLKKGSNLRLYASGQNLWTLTDYPGYDPEVRTYTKNPQKRGVDFGSYPGTKTLLMGLKINY